ncbi:MAG TPA: hypothetical protein VJT67_15025, partial [Longimicrobiaceae bacterium]|nr:hypothetical protein [Longimicrobiaceae bacterium]
EDGEPVLIDGEKLHLALPGQDLVEVIANALAARPDDPGFFGELLAWIAPGDALRRAVVAWAGLIVLESLAREHALDRHDAARGYARTWSALLRQAGLPDRMIP